MSSTANRKTEIKNPRFNVLDAPPEWRNKSAGLECAWFSTKGTNPEAIREAVRHATPKSLWILPRPTSVDGLITVASAHTTSSGHTPRMGTLWALGPVRQESLQVADGYFDRVVGGTASFKTLRPGEFFEVLSTPKEKARDLFIGGLVDDRSQTLALVRGDFRRLAVPLSLFSPSGTTEPDFGRFEIDDHGQTLRFGEYEAAADFVLYALDADFRRRSNARRVQFDKGFGPSLRRLRLLRKLGRDAFDGIDEKTIARIETGKVKRLHAKTLQVICKTLGVDADDVETY